MITIRIIWSIVTTKNLQFEQLGVKIAFLHGDLEEDIHTWGIDFLVQVWKENFRLGRNEKLEHYISERPINQLP